MVPALHYRMRREESAGRKKGGPLPEAERWTARNLQRAFPLPASGRFDSLLQALNQYELESGSPQR